MALNGTECGDDAALTAIVRNHDLQQAARTDTFQVEPFLTVAAACEAMIGRLDRTKDSIEMLCELGVAGAVRLGTDDVRPAFLGELHRATVDIDHRREDSHANAVLDRLSFPFPTLTFGTRVDADPAVMRA